MTRLSNNVDTQIYYEPTLTTKMDDTQRVQLKTRICGLAVEGGRTVHRDSSLTI